MYRISLPSLKQTKHFVSVSRNDGYRDTVRSFLSINYAYSTKKVSTKGVPYDSSLHNTTDKNASTSFPTEADVVVIGGGSVGCSTAYHLAKMGVGNVVLLENHKLTSGTTWHTAGLLWRLVPHDFEIELIDHTRKLMTEILTKESGQETGWVQTGGLFTAYTNNRMDAYKEMSTIGKFFGIESYIINPAEITDVHPLLDVSKLVGACYSPLDGTMDPAGTCITYTRAAAKLGAKIFEGSTVKSISTKVDSLGIERIECVYTDQGNIRTNNVVNCTGVWAPYIGEMVGIFTPQVPYRHAYVVTDSIAGISKTPNVRDHDGSIYLKRQGDTLQIGGYEPNPIPLYQVEKDFSFGLYDLDWDVFGRHIEVANDIVPAISQTGIRSTVCGPESFTPDGKPLLGESPKVRGFFFGSAFNSGGMMLGGGAGREIANWVVKGKPEVDLFAWDIRRFPSSLVRNKTWLTEKSHEGYAKHYSIAFHYDQPLAARNLRTDALYKKLLNRGCYYEEKHGWERPGYFLPERKPIPALKYDYYGYYDNEKHNNHPYDMQLQCDYTYSYPGEAHRMIGIESLTCRTSACLFNSSYMGKIFLTGPDAGLAAKHLFSRDVTGGSKRNPCTYTLMLNDKGGIESDLVVTKLQNNRGEIEYYMTVGGATTEYCKGHVTDKLNKLDLKCNVEDRTEDMVILSLQGPKSREILQNVLKNDKILKLKFSRWMPVNLAGHQAILMRISFVGEMGYEIHTSTEHAEAIYDVIMEEGEKYGTLDAGYRSLEALSTEVGFHHWGHSIRTDDTPVESRLIHLCRDEVGYVGLDAIRKMREEEPKKILACFTVDQPVQMFGHELIWRNGAVVGYIRNAVHSFAMNKEIAFGYVKRTGSLSNLSDNVVLGGQYQIERMGKLFSADLHLSSPFDPGFSRMMGKYNDACQRDLELKLQELISNSSTNKNQNRN